MWTDIRTGIQHLWAMLHAAQKRTHMPFQNPMCTVACTPGTYGATDFPGFILAALPSAACCGRRRCGGCVHVDHRDPCRHAGRQPRRRGVAEPQRDATLIDEGLLPASRCYLAATPAPGLSVYRAWHPLERDAVGVDKQLVDSSETPSVSKSSSSTRVRRRRSR